jgi:hypothetical protein
MSETISDYVFAIFYFLVSVVFVMSIFVSVPERNNNEFSE